MSRSRTYTWEDPALPAAAAAGGSGLEFPRPITVHTGKVRAVGTVLSAVRRTALAQAELYDTDDRRPAHATSSCLPCSPYRTGRRGRTRR